MFLPSFVSRRIFFFLCSTGANFLPGRQHWPGFKWADVRGAGAPRVDTKREADALSGASFLFFILIHVIHVGGAGAPRVDTNREADALSGAFFLS